MKQSKNHKGLIVFYSYASADEDLRNRLAKHLIQLKHEELISEWYDQQILAGSDRAQAIDQAIHSAHLILLLVSSDYLASDTCYQTEMQQAMARHKRNKARVIPIILRPCDWQHSPLKDFQCLPRDGKPVTKWSDQDEAFHTITQSLRGVIEQQARSLVPLSLLDRQNRTRMLRQVRAIWIDGLLKQSLHHAARIELSLQDRSDVLTNAWQLQYQELDQVPQSLPDGTTIAQVYESVNGELLILGEPGAGKTTLLLELTRTLLEQAEKDELLPMPIVFNLSSWAEKRQPLHTWLEEELWMKYQVPRKIGNAWVEADQILPLLDGLDEVAKDVRSACVEQINGYYQTRLERGSSPIVICCRSEEYATLSTCVMLQHAVSILPLTDSQINIYLEQAGEQVKGPRQALDEDAELHNLARQPLMLNIFMLAYQGAQASEVPTGETREEMRHTIFARYVERMLRRREQSKRWKSEQTIHWLTFLAKQMQRHDQTVFSVESLQLTWLSRRWRVLYLWCAGSVSGLATGPGFGLICGLPAWLVIGPVAGLVVWLVAGLGFGLIVGLTVGLDTRINPAEALTWSWKKARSGLVIGLVIGLAVGLAVGLVVGLAAGLAFGLLVGISRRQLLERRSLSPNEGIWRSGRNGLIVGSLVWLISGQFVGSLVWLIGGQFVGLLIGLIVWLIGGLFVWLIGGLFSELGTGGLDAFVKHFILRILLYLRGDLPWPLVPFLDEAAKRLLLRKVGGSYIFAHRLLLDYFVAIDESMLSESTSSEDKIGK